ncbi:peptidase M48-like protein [Asanoa ferruginea]|uniref:Peptidase M48-like protein n=1 Tax=Asanoa ferruginea TaxID=53367 RepID=A0A3D9ZVX5_9ACTN|nr:M56 family metallopeptidase [Asanoa ferruginea]REG00234.1 peptidase M48-like protein [Asanoa ferruginea]GIF46067.1 peptidase M48 [Asanoa ferruginea]
MIAANLLALTLLIGFAGGRWLPAAAWARQAPRLAIAAWCVLLGTVGAGILAVGVTVLLPAPPVVCALLFWCVHPDSPATALALRVAGDMVALGLAGTLLTALVRAGWLLRAQVRSRRRHRAMLTLAGRPDAALGGTVIEHPRAAAYLAPDRRVVVTSGALEELSPAQLGAVLAHEHAHAGGRHQVLLDAVRLAARALPGLRLTRVAQQQIGRLVELRADDVAARTHGRRALAAALVTMAGATPPGLVAAHGGDVAERLRRLLVPPKRLGPWRSAAIVAALLVVAALPVVGLALDGWWPGLVRCVWIG